MSFESVHPSELAEPALWKPASGRSTCLPASCGGVILLWGQYCRLSGAYLKGPAWHGHEMLLHDGFPASLTAVRIGLGRRPPAAR
jgi:hypothetical protein